MNRKSLIRKTFSYLCVLLSLTCCTERIHEIPEEGGSGIPVSFSVSKLEQMPFAAVQTRAGAGLGCSMMTFAVYSCDSLMNRITYSNQKSTDAGFGTFSASLEEGRYKLMVLAHNAASHPTTTKPREIEFKSNPNGLKMTDTFLFFDEIEISKSNADFDLTLSRVVAKFQLSLQDEQLPSELTTLKFYYTGGSCTLDATTGLGCKDNKLTEMVAVDPEIKDYEVYTFIKNDKLKMTITAMNGDASLKEIILDNVPITRNYITRYSGEMFAAPMTESDFKVCVIDEWAGTTNHTF